MIKNLKKQMQINIIYLTIISICFISCKENKAEKVLDFRINYPSTLILIKSTQKKDVNNNQNEKDKNLKFICVVEIGCDECIKGMNTWSSFVDSLKALEINTTIICCTNDTSYLSNYILPKLETKATFLADKKVDFIKTNIDLYSIPDVNVSFLLVDENNQIQMYGDPFLNNSTKQIYWYVINKFQKENTL